MSNNTTATQTVLDILKSNSKKKGGQVASRNYQYSFSVPSELEGIKLPPQAITLIGIMLEDENDTWMENELYCLITANGDALKTKQEPWKIFQYYRKTMEDAGFLSREKVEA